MRDSSAAAVLLAPCSSVCEAHAAHCARCREAVRSSNAAVVLRTLVPQAREIFRLLAQAQLVPDADEEGCEGVLLCSRSSTHAMLGDTISVNAQEIAPPRCR